MNGIGMNIPAPAAFEQAMATAAQKAPGSLTPAQLAKTRETAQDFEAMFLSEMMNHMFEGVDVDPMFGGGKGEEIFRSMMVQEYGKMMSKNPQGLGLATHIEKAMIEMQERLQTQPE